MRIKELSQKYGMCEDAIRKFIKDGLLHPQEGWKRGLPFDIDEEEFLKVKRLYWSDRTNFRYQIGWNHSIFHNIDTPEKAYWLGFILADGCLHITGEDFRGHVSIDISGTDKEHLYKFSSFIEATKDMIKITHHANTGNELVHISLCGKEVVEDLYNLGIRPRKSGKEQYIETGFPRDSIRGCYDGDGYIKKDLHSIGLVGSYDLLYTIQQVFYKELGIVPRKIGEHGTIYRIEYTAKEDKKKIANYLWYDGCVSLDRKQKLADEIKKLC